MPSGFMESAFEPADVPAFAPDVKFINVVGMHGSGLPDVKRAHQMKHETFLAQRDGHWLIVSAHNTPIDEMAARSNPISR